MCLTSDGFVYSWGSNNLGQLGIPDATTKSLFPMQLVDTNKVLQGKTISSISAGAYFSILQTSDGKIYSYGRNLQAELGDGSMSQKKASPGSVIDSNNVLLGTTVSKISAGYDHSIALTADGRVVTWGGDDKGQLGDEPTTPQNPVIVDDTQNNLKGFDVVGAATGNTHSVILGSNEHVYA
jgi:alpha-tubulin suppressor-like RCC1 family protein